MVEVRLYKVKSSYVRLVKVKIKISYVSTIHKET